MSGTETARRARTKVSALMPVASWACLRAPSGNSETRRDPSDQIGPVFRREGVEPGVVTPAFSDFEA